MKYLSKLSSYAGWVFMLLLCLLIASKTLAYMDFKIKDILVGREALLEQWTYFSAFYLHVAMGSFALLTGPFQFIKKLRVKSPRFHIALGKAYILACLIAGFAGLFVGFYANGGLVGRVGFILAAICWIWCTRQAYVFAKRRAFKLHRQWVTMSFAMTFAAVTLRAWIGVWLTFGLEYELTYQIVAWLSWVPNVLLAYLFTCRKTRPSIA